MAQTPMLWDHNVPVTKQCNSDIMTLGTVMLLIQGTSHIFPSSYIGKSPYLFHSFPVIQGHSV